jgi:hypothetical protein
MYLRQLLVRTYVTYVHFNVSVNMVKEVSKYY